MRNCLYTCPNMRHSKSIICQMLSSKRISHTKYRKVTHILWINIPPCNLCQESLQQTFAAHQLSPQCAHYHCIPIGSFGNTAHAPPCTSLNLCLTPTDHDSVFWHGTLPPECCSVSCRRNPSRRSPCPCTSRWRGSRWTPGRRSPAACWKPPGGRTTSGPSLWTTRAWAEKRSILKMGSGKSPTAAICTASLYEHRYLPPRDTS